MRALKKGRKMFLIPCIMIIIFAVIVATYFKTTFAKALPSSIILMVFIVYISGFLNNLLIGIYALYILAIIFLVLVVANYKNVRESAICILKDRTLFSEEDEKWVHEESTKEAIKILSKKNENIEE